MGELNTVTISLDRFENLLRDSYDLRRVNTDIEHIRTMVFDGIADDCLRYGERYADGDSSSIACRKLFRAIGINDPSKNPTVQKAVIERRKKEGKEA